MRRAVTLTVLGAAALMTTGTVAPSSAWADEHGSAKGNDNLQSNMNLAAIAHPMAAKGEQSGSTGGGKTSKASQDTAPNTADCYKDPTGDD